MLPLTRVCARCHAEKPLDAFPIKNSARGTRVSYCVPCRSEYGKEHYRQNRPYYLAKNAVAKVRHRRANRELAREHLSTHPCVDCGERDPLLLDFDHLDPTTKRGNVSQMLSREAAPAIEREIGKCVVRCGNCHRLRTAQQFGSYRLKKSDHA